MLYQSGVQTVIALSAIYAQMAMGFTTQDTIVLVLLVNITASLGAFLFGQWQDRLGHRRTLALTLLGWCAMVLIAYFTTDRMGFWVAANIAGVCLGASQSAGRALVGYLAPADRHAEFFGLWGFAVKLASILGPLTYGAVTWLTDNDHRSAMLITGVFFVLGLVVLQSGRSRARPPRSNRRLGGARLGGAGATVRLNRSAGDSVQPNRNTGTYRRGITRFQVRLGLPPHAFGHRTRLTERPGHERAWPIRRFLTSSHSICLPGQGSQYRGMGSDLVAEFPVAKDIYARASAVVGYDMTELAFRDPRDELNKTRFTQPALLTHEIACLEAFRSARRRPRATRTRRRPQPRRVLRARAWPVR